MKSTLEKKGIAIHLNTVVQTIEAMMPAGCGDPAVTLSQEIPCGWMLKAVLATGRKPESRKSLNQQAAGIQTTNRGAIEVDSKLRTNIPNIWARSGMYMADYNSPILSLDDYRIIREELFGNGFRSLDDREAVKLFRIHRSSVGPCRVRTETQAR